jgi:hypothetical protein
MVTIENLEVQFDVDGEGDEAVFARLFERHMRRWYEAEELQRQQQRRLAQDNRLGDQPAESLA